MKTVYIQSKKLFLNKEYLFYIYFTTLLILPILHIFEIKHKKRVFMALVHKD